MSVEIGTEARNFFFFFLGIHKSKFLCSVHEKNTYNMKKPYVNDSFASLEVHVRKVLRNYTIILEQNMTVKTQQEL